jgi:N-acetylmuramoyl-L-alanine amidase
MMRAAAIVVVALASLVAAACARGSQPPPVTDDVAEAAQPSLAASPAPDGPRIPTVVLDPGHGGDEVGASNHGVVEKHSNLDMALRIERLLQERGVRVALTRREDARVASPPGSASAFGATRFDLQARVDRANSERADLFLSIHSNGSPDAGQRGVEVWFDPGRTFGERNRAFAQSLQDHVLAELAAYGYAAADRGIKDDTCFRRRNGRCFPLFLLGPERVTTRDEIIRRGGDPDALGLAPGQQSVTTRATQMPGALVELLFISNATDAAVLRDDAARDAIARGIVAAIIAHLPPVPA